MFKLFYPLGSFGPVIIWAKIFVQQLWKANLGWDEALPSVLNSEWKAYRSGLAALDPLSTPRLVKLPGAGETIQIHGFCDASQHAYRACRSVGANGAISSRLLTAKSRIAPIKTLTIPRLELCSSVLLSHLYQNLVSSLNITANAFFRSDSSVTLHWLSNPPATYNTIVANRVAEVQRQTDGGTWNHEAGLENPADLISRGIDPCRLAYIAHWWKGPPWQLELLRFGGRLNQSSNSFPPLIREQLWSLHLRNLARQAGRVLVALYPCSSTVGTPADGPAGTSEEELGQNRRSSSRHGWIVASSEDQTCTRHSLRPTNREGVPSSSQRRRAARVRFRRSNRHTGQQCISRCQR